MTADAGADAPHTSAGDGFSDALTYAFGDPATGVCGVARLGLADGRASGLAIVFRDGSPAAVTADGGIETSASSWDDVAAAGLRTTTLEPMASWQLRFEGECPFELTFDAVSPAFELAAGHPAAEAGGMEGFDQFCRVGGTVGEATFAGLGQRGRSWGAPNWERMTLARTISAWFDSEHALSLVSVRPVGCGQQDCERLAAFSLEQRKDRSAVHDVALPLLSTVYDGEGRQRRAGLELYVRGDDELARRLAGDVVAGTTLELGRLRLHCSFFRWRMEGRVGIGRYDLLERATD